MTPRRWWIGIALVVLALLFFATFPRYEWRQIQGPYQPPYLVRIDRWTGRAEGGRVGQDGWRSYADAAAQAAKDAAWNRDHPVQSPPPQYDLTGMPR